MKGDTVNTPRIRAARWYRSTPRQQQALSRREQRRAARVIKTQARGAIVTPLPVTYAILSRWWA